MGILFPYPVVQKIIYQHWLRYPNIAGLAGSIRFYFGIMPFDDPTWYSYFDCPNLPELERNNRNLPHFIGKKHGGFHTWGYPYIIHVNAIFPYKASVFGYPHGYGNTDLKRSWFEITNAVLRADPWKAQWRVLCEVGVETGRRDV